MINPDFFGVFYFQNIYLTLFNNWGGGPLTQFRGVRPLNEKKGFHLFSQLKN